jgi:hypothetical protein
MLDETRKFPLTPVESALLAVVAEAGDLDTEAAATRVIETLRASGESFSLIGSRPWFGLSEAARRLEDVGALEIDVDMASVVPRGMPAPTADRYFLVTSIERLRRALEGVEHLGPVRVEPSETTDDSNNVVRWFVVTIEVICGRDTVNVTGAGTAQLIALAHAFDRALTRWARSQ